MLPSNKGRRNGNRTKIADPSEFIKLPLKQLTKNRWNNFRAELVIVGQSKEWSTGEST